MLWPSDCTRVVNGFTYVPVTWPLNKPSGVLIELLELSGVNELPDLAFLNELPHLKTFIFSMNMLSGDLTPCLRMPYACSLNNRRHYNLKDDDLPKQAFCHGNEAVPMWRRLE